MSTLGVIRANVRRNLGEDSARFFSNAELNQFIGEAYRKYVILMIEEGDGYFVTTESVPIVLNDPYIDLTALSLPFFNVRQLAKITTFGFVPLKTDQMRFKTNYKYTTGTGDNYLPTYRVQGMNIVLQPTPTYSESVSTSTGLQLEYAFLPTFPDASSADSYEMEANFSPGYEPLIELYATIAALESKDGMGGVSDINSFRDRKNQWEQTFMDSLEREEYPDSVAYIGTNFPYNY